ncbi:MAG: glycosyltransferase family 39 protein [Planctomycetota bacterium]
MSERGAGSVRGALLGVVAVLAIGAAVYLPWLGSRGFGASEGHRVVPAVEFAERGSWLVPTMFDTPYLRKPPGMPIAIMLSSEAFGWTELSARLVSAASVILTGGLLAMIGSRWFGSRVGWTAGAAYVLSPVVLPIGRAAEIEALHGLFVTAAAVLAIELVLRKPGKALDRAVIGGVAFGIALLGALLTKGPAGAPSIIGAVIAGVLLAGRPRRWRSIASPAILVGVVVAGGVSLWLYSLFMGDLRQRSEPYVTQSPLAFSFEAGRLLAIAGLPIAALGSHLPAGLAMLPLLGWRGSRPGDRLARAAALAWCLSIVVFMLFGVSNNRYVLPSLGLACLVVPWAIDGFAHRFGGWRRLLCGVGTLGSPRIVLAVLVVAAGARHVLVERREAIKSGREPGIAIADALAEDTSLPIELWADELIEARPETLLATERRGEELGRELRVFWSASWDPVEADGPSLPAAPAGLARYAVLRRDTDQYGSSELERFVEAGLAHRLVPVYDGGIYPDGTDNEGNTVYRYPITVFRIAPE